MPITGLKICYGDLGIPIFPLFLFSNTPFHDTRNYDDEVLMLTEISQLLWAAQGITHPGDTGPLLQRARSTRGNAGVPGSMVNAAVCEQTKGRTVCAYGGGTCGPECLFARGFAGG